MIKHTPSEGVLVAINLTMGTEGPRRSVYGAVPVRFLNVGSARAVDISESRGCVERQCVWTNPDNGALGS